MRGVRSTHRHHANVRQQAGYRGRVPLVALALAALLTVVIALSASNPGPVAAAGTPLREVDWDAVLLNDPTISAQVRKLGGLSTVHVSVPMLDGYPLEGDVISSGINYGDLDGDGDDEAVVHVFGG